MVDRTSESKRFFFEKKNQKTFISVIRYRFTHCAKTIKVFLLLFVHKKKSFLQFSLLSSPNG